MGKKVEVKKSDYYLLNKKEEVKNIISGKISAANELLSAPINSTEDLEKIQKAHTTWKDYI